MAEEHGMASRNMVEVATATRGDINHSIQGLRSAQPAGPGLDTMKAARVSVTAQAKPRLRAASPPHLSRVIRPQRGAAIRAAAQSPGMPTRNSGESGPPPAACLSRGASSLRPKDNNDAGIGHIVTPNSWPLNRRGTSGGTPCPDFFRSSKSSRCAATWSTWRSA